MGNIILVQTLHGFVYGMLLFLVSSGLTLIFGLMGVLNFAHGALYMLGAYFSFTILRFSGSFWASLVFAPLLVAVLGIAIERFLLRKVHVYGHAHQLLLTFGIAYIIEELVKWIWGNEPVLIKIPEILSGSVKFLGITYPTYRLFILASSSLVFIFLLILFLTTRAGLIVKAAVFNPDMLSALGVNVPRAFTMLFGLGCWLAGIAGVIGGPYLITHPGMGMAILIDVFVVIVIGGMGSLEGALIASLLIGQIYAFGVMVIPQFAMVFEYLLMILILAFRPRGLLGERE